MIKRTVSILIVAVIVISTMVVNVGASINTTEEKTITNYTYGYQCRCRLVVGTKYATVGLYCNPTGEPLSRPSTFTATYFHENGRQIDYAYDWGYPDIHETYTLPDSCDEVIVNYSFMTQDLTQLRIDVPN